MKNACITAEEHEEKIRQADRTHDWVKSVELPWCKVCGLGKISAHVWGDDSWTEEPIACPGKPIEEMQEG